jgi:polyhydroxybutyrate depolymerase
MSLRFVIGLLVVAASACEPTSADEPEPPPEPAPPDAELVATRPYAVTVPKSYSPDVPAPVVLLLHGYGSNGNEVDAWFGFSKLAEDAGFLCVLPNGTIDARGYRGWNVDPVHSKPFDVEYLRGVIADVQSKYNVDAKRIYAVGVSAGAHMAHRLGCELSDKVAAIVSVAGQVTKDPAGCAPSQPVSALEVHGTADEVIFYDGDPYDPSLPTAHETIGVWARNDRCTGPLAPNGKTLDLVTDVDGPETHEDAYSGCPAGIGVELWTMDGAPHHPSVKTSWARHLYTFLEAHPK